MRQKQYPKQIYIDNVRDLLRRVLYKRLAPCHASIINEHIDPPEHGQRLFCQMSYLRKVSDIGWDGNCVVSGLVECVRLYLQLVYTPCRQHYLCSTPGKLKCGSCADT